MKTHNSELKNKITVLQQELDNSEAVQQDFVRLSQSLQVNADDINLSRDWNRTMIFKTSSNWFNCFILGGIGENSCGRHTSALAR